MSKQKLSNHLNSTHNSLLQELITLRATRPAQLDRPGVVVCCQCLSFLRRFQTWHLRWDQTPQREIFLVSTVIVTSVGRRKYEGRQDERFDRMQFVFFIWGPQSIHRAGSDLVCTICFYPRGWGGYEAIIHSSLQHCSLIEVDNLSQYSKEIIRLDEQSWYNSLCAIRNNVSNLECKCTTIKILTWCVIK